MELHIYARTTSGPVIGEIASGGAGVQIYPVDNETVGRVGSRTYAMSRGQLIDSEVQSSFWAFRCTGCHRMIAGNHQFAYEMLGQRMIPAPQGTLYCDEVASLTAVRSPNAISNDYFDGVCYVDGHDCLFHIRPCVPRYGGVCNGRHAGLAGSRRCAKCDES